MDEEKKEIKTAEEWKKEGNDAYKNKQYEKAIQAYSEAIALNGNDHSYYSNRAICHFNIQNFLECCNDCDECMKINPKFTKAMRRKGMALIEMLKFAEAVFNFKSAY